MWVKYNRQKNINKSWLVSGRDNLIKRLRRL